MEIDIISYHGFAAWTWNNVRDDLCGVCRQAFNGCCDGCTLPGDDCPVIQGKCLHSFHMHCILRWIQSQNGEMEVPCPMCRRPWQFLTADDDEEEDKAQEPKEEEENQAGTASSIMQEDTDLEESHISDTDLPAAAIATAISTP